MAEASRVTRAFPAARAFSVAWASRVVLAAPLARAAPVAVAALVALSVAVPQAEAAEEATAPEPQVYTLYRSNPVDRLAADHVATFDSRRGAAANAEACRLVARLLDARPEAERRHWCRPGRGARQGASR